MEASVLCGTTSSRGHPEDLGLLEPGPLDGEKERLLPHLGIRCRG